VLQVHEEKNNIPVSLHLKTHWSAHGIMHFNELLQTSKVTNNDTS